MRGVFSDPAPMPTPAPAVAFVWADESSHELEAELNSWFGQRRRVARPRTQFSAFVAGRAPQALRGARR